MVLPTRPPPGEAKEKPQTVLQHRLRQTIHCLAQDRKAYFMNSNLPKRIQPESFHSLSTHPFTPEEANPLVNHSTRLAVSEPDTSPQAKDDVEVSYSDLFSPPLLVETEHSEGAETNNATCGNSESSPSSGDDPNEEREQYRGEHPFDYSIGKDLSRSGGGEGQ